jgi:esterase/lipase superfamily enzyme
VSSALVPATRCPSASARSAAAATACRHPDAFRLAIAMSGGLDLPTYLHARMNSDCDDSSPPHHLPAREDGPQLAPLRERLLLLATGARAGRRRRVVAAREPARRQGRAEPCRPVGPRMGP